jgi:hypothetical protein
MPHTHSHASRARHNAERARTLAAKRLLTQHDCSPTANLDAPPPRWAGELAQRIQYEDDARREIAAREQGGGYVPPGRQPWTETAALLQRERERLAAHLVEAAKAETAREAHVHEAARFQRTTEAARPETVETRPNGTTVHRSQPAPADHLTRMVTAGQQAHRLHPNPADTGVLPLSPRSRVPLERVQEQAAERLPAALAEHQPGRLRGELAALANARMLQAAEAAATEQLPPGQRRVWLATQRGQSIEQAASALGIPVRAARALLRGAAAKMRRGG